MTEERFDDVPRRHCRRGEARDAPLRTCSSSRERRSRRTTSARKENSHIIALDLNQFISADQPAEDILRGHPASGRCQHRLPSPPSDDRRVEIGTCYLWDHRKEPDELVDVWEAANRDDLFSVTSLKHYPVRGQQRLSQAEASLLLEDAGAIGEVVAGHQGGAQIECQRRHHALPKEFLLISRDVSRTVIIVNPISGPKRRGTGAERVDVATRTLERLGAKGEIRLTERAGHAHELSLEAAASGADLVIGWGGDGTINEVARALVQRDDARVAAPALGIIPGRPATDLRASWGFRSILRRRSNTRFERTFVSSMRVSSAITCSLMWRASGSTRTSRHS